MKLDIFYDLIEKTYEKHIEKYFLYDINIYILYSPSIIRIPMVPRGATFSSEAAEMLADASIVPAFIRLCGAKMGPGCVMGLQAWGAGWTAWGFRGQRKG